MTDGRGAWSAPVAALFAFALFAVAVPGSAQPAGSRFQFGAVGGVTFLLPDTGFNTGSGYHVALFAQYNAQKAISLRVEAGFASASGLDPDPDPHLSNGSRRIFSGMADVILSASGRVRPYMFAGGGAARITAKATGYSDYQGVFTVEDEKNPLGFRFGAGVSAPSGGIAGVFLELRYSTLPSSGGNLIPSDAYYLSLVAGVRF